MSGRHNRARWAALAVFVAADAALAQIPTESGSQLSEVQRLKNLAFTANSNLYVQPTQAQVSSFYTLALDVRAGNYNQAETEANALDYTLSDFTDTSTGRSYYELDENLVNGQQTLGWGSYFWNPSFTQDVLVEVPHTLADENTEDLGTRVMQDANARGFLMAGAHRDADGTGTADVAHLSSSIFLAVDEAWVGPSAQTTAYQIHAFDIDNHGTFPADAQAVLSDGAGNVTSRLVALDTQFRSIGYPTYVYDTYSPSDPRNQQVNGSVDGNSLSGLGATTNVEGQYNRSIGGTFVHVEMSPTIRDSSTNRIAAANAIAASMTEIQPVSIKAWSGATSNEWSVAGNWSPAAVPTTSDAVLFDNSIESPLPAAMTLTDANLSVKYLTWNSNDSSTITNATTTSNNDTLTLNGDGESFTTPLIQMGLNATNNNVTFSRTNTSGAGATAALVIVLGHSGAIDVVNAGATLTLDCQINESNGPCTLEKTGDGTLVVLNNAATGTNGFTGGIILTDGVFSTNSYSGTGPTPGSVMPGFFTFNCGTFEFTGPSPSTNVSGNRGITVSAAGGTIDIATAGVDVTMSGVITGSGALTKSGPGELVLGSTGASNLNFIGGFVISGGDLSILNGGALGPTTTPAVQVTLNGGALRWRGINTASSLSVNHEIAITSAGGGIDVFNASTALTVSGIISGSGALAKTGPGTLVLSAGNTFTGGVIIDGGTISASAGSALGTGADASAPAVNLTLDNNGTFAWTSTSAAVTLSSGRQVQIDAGGGIINVQNAVTLDVAGTVVGPGVLTKTGMGVLEIPKARTGGLNVSAGAVQIASNGGSAGVSVLPALIVGDNTSATAAKLDLNDNDLILPYTTNSPIATIRGLLVAGYNGGTWTGNGIASSTAAADPNKLIALGYGETIGVGITSLDGQSISGPAVIVKYTYYGDSSLDGKVDLGNDFNLFLQGFLNQGSGWEFGDYNYDGNVDLSDFQLFVAGFAGQGNDLGSLDAVIAGDPELTIAQKASLLSAVPEPASGGLVLAGAFVLAGRRRRKSHIGVDI